MDQATLQLVSTRLETIYDGSSQYALLASIWIWQAGFMKAKFANGTVIDGKETRSKIPL